MTYCCKKFEEGATVLKSKFLYSKHFGNWIACFDGYDRYDDIFYCPFCGKKLEPEPNPNIYNNCQSYEAREFRVV